MPRKAKTYKVVGTAPIFAGGVRRLPDETFTASLEEEQETYLVELGALEIKQEKKEKK